MNLLIVYIIGSVVTLILNIIMSYIDYKNGIDIPLENIYFAVAMTTISWVGLLICIIIILSYFSNRIIIKGKETEK